MCEFLDKLNDIYNSWDINMNQCRTTNDILTKFLLELNKYNDVVKEFFIGKANDIRKIYSSIENKEFVYNKIKIVDINIAIFIYSDYLKGLKEFVDNIKEIQIIDGKQPIDIRTSIEKVKESSNILLDNIFGGSDNPEYDAGLDEALKNIESIVEFDEFKVKEINDFQFNLLEKSSENIRLTYGEDLMLLAKYISESIIKFFFHYYRHLIQTFCDINDSMKQKVNANDVFFGRDKEMNKYKIY